MTEAKGDDQRCGFVALIGAPNSGKSTLINALVGAKVAIVTQKAQTTRAPVLGIALEGRSQIILVDTPRHLSAQTPARPRHVGSGLDPRRGSRSRGAGDRRRACAHGTRARRLARPRIRDAPHHQAARHRRAQQDRPRGEARASAPRRRPLHAPRLRAHLHDLGAQRRRRSRPQRPISRSRAARPLALSRRTSSPMRRSAKPPPRSREKSSSCGCMTSFPTA